MSHQLKNLYIIHFPLDKTPRIPPAGRPTTTCSRASSPSLVDVTMMVSSSSDTKKQTNSKAKISLSTLSLDNKDTYVPVYTQKTVSETITNNSLVSDENSINNLNDSGASSSDSTASTLKNSKLSDSCSMINELNPKKDECTDESIEYTDNDLDEALRSELTENAIKQIEKVDDADDKENLLANLDISEGHYMPMTPKKPILSLSESDIFTSLKPNSIGNVTSESAYVEMTRNGLSTSILADDYKNDYDLVCINSSHHKQTASEPVYMEPAQLKKPYKKIQTVINNGKTTIKKSALKKYSDVKMKKISGVNLPDILNLSQNDSNQLTISVSDSSDADNDDDHNDDDEDDESIGGLEFTSGSRLSLSDTFRPASYYLGATTPLSEFPDSSDSEIVSPPSIPSSSSNVSLEKLKTEEIFLSENYDTVKRRNDQKTVFNLSYDRLPKIHLSNSSLNSFKKDNIKTSRLSLPDHFAKFKNAHGSKIYQNESDYGFSNFYPNRLSSDSMVDDSSIDSSDYDLFDKVKIQSFSSGNNSKQLSVGGGSGSDQTTVDSETESIELRFSAQHDLTDSQLKRRPLSVDSFSKESLDGKFDDNIDTLDLDSYLNKLQIDDTHSSDRFSESKLYDIPLIKPPAVFRSDNDEQYYKNINFVSSPSESIEDEYNKLIECENQSYLANIKVFNYLTQNSNTETAAKLVPCDSLEHVNKPDTFNQIATSQTPTDIAFKQNNTQLTNETGQSKDYMININQISPYKDFEISARSNFNHHRNSSNLSEQSAPYYYADLNGKIVCHTDDQQCMQKLNNQRDIGQKKIGTGITHIQNPINRATTSNAPTTSNTFVMDAKSISAEILNVTDKDRSINRKNLFESREIKMEKNVCKELSSGYAGNKIYGKSECPKISTQNKNNNKLNQMIGTQQPQKSNDQQSNIYQIPASSAAYREKIQTTVNRRAIESSGDILWEEDSIWRENLRRVSHRHARSLDGLDRIDGPSTSTTPNATILTKPLKKEQKDTYANVSISHQQNQSIVNLKENPNIVNADNDWNSKNDENDVYVQLSIDQNNDNYDRLIEDHNIGVSKKHIQMNREIIRQWDSMSSGLMKSATGSNISTTKNDQGILIAENYDATATANTPSTTANNSNKMAQNTNLYHPA